MTSPFQPVDPENEDGGKVSHVGAMDKRRRRLVPFRALLPNMVTLLAICAGLTAIRLAIEGNFELAVGAIILAAILDAIAGCSNRRRVLARSWIPWPISSISASPRRSYSMSGA